MNMSHGILWENALDISNHRDLLCVYLYYVLNWVTLPWDLWVFALTMCNTWHKRNKIHFHNREIKHNLPPRTQTVLKILSFSIGIFHYGKICSQSIFNLTQVRELFVWRCPLHICKLLSLTGVCCTIASSKWPDSICDMYILMQV